MRRVKREDSDVPAHLSTTDETALARGFYEPKLASSPGKKIKAYPFGAYKHSSVRKALENLFHGKCAYCENHYTALHPVDVEHWRPKGEVEIEGRKKGEWYHGYYWLAAEWENLLPACIDCNRERWHTDIVTGRVVKLGKQNWFPVADETKRWRDPDQHPVEEPLLLNPCTDRPDEFIKFNTDGVVEIRPKSEPKRLRAIASIRFYGLNRSDLVAERLEKIKEMQQIMTNIRSNMRSRIAAIERNDHQEVANVDEMLASNIKYLKRMREPEARFSAMASHLITGFLDEISK